MQAGIFRLRGYTLRLFDNSSVGHSLCSACQVETTTAEERQLKWDLRYLRQARGIATECSKDPSTKTGAVIVDSDGGLVSTGFNGFARKVKDTPERYADRDTKIAMILHCEENAILFAERWRLKGATLYTWPFMSCAKCAGMVVQVGISRCVAPPLPAHLQERWGKNIELAKMQFEEAGVQLDIIEVTE